MAQPAACPARQAPGGLVDRLAARGSMLKVLVGITTRNRAAILPGAIQSALDQDYPLKEVAVFDDASDDGTNGLRETFPEVRWVRSDARQGCRRGRELLMQDATSDVFVGLDDDAWFIAGDEISAAMQVLETRPQVAAMGFDVLSVERPLPEVRSSPRDSHMFIGCGHVVRLSAFKEVGGYEDAPGYYGSEEKDLSLRLVDRGYEVVSLPGVHVWHEKTILSRDVAEQHASGVCNDLSFALWRCPARMLLWVLPGKIISHVWFSMRTRLSWPCAKGLARFLAAAPDLLRQRSAVRSDTFREMLRRSRAGVASQHGSGPRRLQMLLEREVEASSPG